MPRFFTNRLPTIFTSLMFLAVILPGLANANSLQQIQQDLKANRYAQAAASAKALLKQQPDDLQLHFITALALQKNAQPEQAIRHYQAIIADHPKLPEPRNNLAIIYLQQGQYDQAIDLLIESLNTHPAYATAWKNLNNIYQGLASEAYRKALSDDNDTRSMLHTIQLSALDTLTVQPLKQPLTIATAPRESAPLPPAQSKAVKPSTAEPSITKTPIKIAAAPKPVAAPAPKPKPTLTTATKPQVVNNTVKIPTEKQLISILNRWASAWRDQEFDQYVTAYTTDYKGRYRNHQQWVKERRKRVIRADRITLELSQFQVKSLSAQRAIINFQQRYQSATYRDKVVKRIHLVNQDGQWKIAREVTLSVL